MSKNVIVIMDSVQTFVKGFKRYIEKETDNQVVCMTSFEEMAGLTFDYLLVEEDKMEACPYKDKRLFVLTNDLAPKASSLSRFDRPNVIYQQMITHYTKTYNSLKTVAIYSMAGGTGKTTLANGLCEAVESVGHVPVYISFSIDTSSEPMIDLSLLIYYFSQNMPIPGSAVEKIERILVAAKSTVRCFINRPEDSLYLTPKLIQDLLSWFSQSFDIQFMIVEAPWPYGPCLEAVLKFSTFKILIGDQRHSSAALLEWQQVYRQTINNDKGDYIVLNKQIDEREKELTTMHINTFEAYTLKKGMKEWCNKYLLTHWMR